ncbi:DUF4166 domain-containing protein [Psychromarinibacter sp. C21-152]|uniref:DUF4166 domain-containing protein n=1 Tax=Psychromarinibacter sediminicola TaxID=3033385 RepID=A0AAE3NMP5_9RHOB|nr:DUF4166 domain-containing protein [Psychromarinibacter sediminicola]MDF0600148.1 DUF4166 domain-containing protein [Psychromarinibacter sediminicola]
MADPVARACAARGVELPPLLRRFHDGRAQVWRGTATVTRGRRWPVPLILRAAGFPPEGAEVETVISVAPAGDGMVWERRFGGHVTRSRLRDRAGRVEEGFGPFRLALVPRAVAGGVALEVAGLWLLGLPLPRLLWPRAEVSETGADDALCFDIGAALPGLGLLIRYRGRVTPAD